MSKPIGHFTSYTINDGSLLESLQEEYGSTFELMTKREKLFLISAIAIQLSDQAPGRCRDEIYVVGHQTCCNTDPLEVAQDAMHKGGFAMNMEWVESMKCWVEGFDRGRELADFLETSPPQGTREGTRAFWEFYQSQHDRWIEGNQEPHPINSIEDIHPSLRTPELERLIKMHQVESAMAQGDYSVLDVLTGRPMVDSLNIIDAENTYSLAGYDDEFDEDEIYE